MDNEVIDEQVVQEPIESEATNATESEAAPVNAVATDEIAAIDNEAENAAPAIEPVATDETTAASESAPPLPEKQAKRHESYAPEIMEHYRRKFGLSAEDLAARKWWALLKSKIDSDIHIASLNKEIATLKARGGAMLRVIGKLTKPRAGAKPVTPASNA